MDSVAKTFWPIDPCEEKLKSFLCAFQVMLLIAKTNEATDKTAWKPKLCNIGVSGSVRNLSLEAICIYEFRNCIGPIFE